MNRDCRLTEFSLHCGCAAKVGAQYLCEILNQLPGSVNQNLIVGLESFDDAGVYKLDENTALVQTVDFFPPIVDDPYLFGSISACNALSDVFAMGGKPVTCLAIVCFPTKKLSLEILGEILKGGFDKVKEAGAIIVGGHTIEDGQPKYGLAVTGIINPGKVITNAGMKSGDSLVLTKPLGTGIIVTAAKGELAKPEDFAGAINSMTTLNKVASQIMQEAGANAATDITGFGLLGHLFQMAKASRVAVNLWMDHIPILKGALEYANLGLVPEGAYNNRIWVGNNVLFDTEIVTAEKDILFDPQTSGGLLIALPKERADVLLLKLKESGCKSAACIGEVFDGEAGLIKVKRRKNDDRN